MGVLRDIKLKVSEMILTIKAIRQNELHIKSEKNVKIKSKANKYSKTALPKRLPETNIDTAWSVEIWAADVHTWAR